jgi:peptidyl-prolyl cis-trans isomerase C
VRIPLLLALLAVAVNADAQTGTASKPKTTAALSVNNRGTMPPVVVITGSCPTAAGTDCRHALTKPEFDRIIGVIDPGLPANKRHDVAMAYAQVYVLANEARKLGLDKDPGFRERLRLEELKILASLFSDAIRKQMRPAEQEIETFYSEHSDRMEELQLRVVIVAKTIDKQSDPESTKTLAVRLRTRALAGEDMDKLQQEATLAVKAPGAPPNSSLGWRGRGRLGQHESQILPLKAGQVSDVLEDAQNYYIYKVDSKRLIPLATVKDEIANAIVRERFDARLAQLLKSVRTEFDPGYFGMPPATESAKQPPADPGR